MNYLKFKIKQQIWSLKGAYKIFDDQDRLRYQIKGNQFSTKISYYFNDEHDQEIYKIHSKRWSFRNDFYISKHDQDLFKVSQSMGFKSELFVENLLEPDAFYISGNIWGSEYKFIKEDIEFALVSKDIWKLADTYGVAIEENQDIALILAIVSIIDIIQTLNSG